MVNLSSLLIDRAPWVEEYLILGSGYCDILRPGSGELRRERGGDLMIIQNTNPEKRRCDAAAAARVFLDHETFIRKVISFHVHDEDEADELFQDFFLSLVCHPLPGDIRNIESYLYRVLTNHVIDAVHRKEAYRGCLREYAERAYRPASQKTPEEAVMETEELSALFELIEERLPRAEAQAACLQYRDSLSAKEIAERMGVGIATARGYVSEGLSRIRRLLSVKGGLTPRRV